MEGLGEVGGTWGSVRGLGEWEGFGGVGGASWSGRGFVE